MSAKFFLSDNAADCPKIDRIAVGLALFHDTGLYPDFLGHYGRFERNAQATLSNLNKVHIALYQADFDLKTWHNRNGATRTCDNFVIYTQHFFERDCFQVLGIVTPNAHSSIDKLLPYFIDKAECFQALNSKQLNKLPFFDCSNVAITEKITLTP